MVLRHSTEDKVTFDPPIEQQALVPWKQLASSPTVLDSDKRKNVKVFDFLDEASTPRPGQPSSSSSEEEGDAPQESGIAAADSPRPKSREQSPMQEKLLLEQNWQNNLIKFDELLSDITASHKGEFSEHLFLSAFKNREILSLLFKLFDWDNKETVSQDKIVDCTRRTFQGHGGREWVELLEVVAYVICKECDVTEECFVRIFQSKGVVEKFYKYIYALNTEGGNISRQFIMDLIANLTYARPRKGFSADNLERLENMFREALGAKKELSFDDFKKIVHSRNSFFAERVFQIFDRDKSGSVSLSEFLDAMHQFTGKSPNDKIKFLFRVYDLDGDGLIQREELEQVMKACMEENGMKFSHEQIEDLTVALFEDADTEQRGEITYEALKAQLEKHPGLLENLSISIDRWLVPPQPQVKREGLVEKLKNLRPYQLTLPYLKNNYVYLLFLISFIAVNVGLFIDRGVTIHNQGHNFLYVLARASGQCLNFNCTFLLVLILRQSLTFLRSHGASSFLPLDQHLYFHKMCGWFVFFHSSLHTLMHLINFPLNIVPDDTINTKGLSAAQWLFTADPGAFGLVKGWANPTGIILMVVLVVMVICSLPFVRKSGYFEVFYWTHLLYIVFWGLTILHGPHFWKWFVGPAIIFTCEKVYRWLKMRTGHGKTYISSGVLLPSKVIHLVIQKPNGFHYHPGDYIFVNIPVIAKYEWHPFTISSAPEQDDAIWLHIRAVGEWTNRLYAYFENQQRQCQRRATTGKLSIQYSNAKTILINVEDDEPKMLIKNCSENGDYDDNSKERKNGVVNVAFESETTNNLAHQTLEHKLSKSAEQVTSTETENKHEEEFLNKKKLVKTKSVPDLDVNMKKRAKNFMFRETVRPNSETSFNPKDLEAAYQMVGNQRMRKIMFPTNRSVAMSVRYMRRKPRVVTLDLPEGDADSSAEDNDETEEDEKYTGDVEAPKGTEVRIGSGRIFGGRVSREMARSQRRKSKQETQKARRISRLKEAEVFGQCTIGTPLVIYCDGPYGAPSSHIFRAQHAVLIGTGIGVTPFASILQSIMHRYLKARQSCPKCQHAWTSDIPQSIMNLRKVDFFWINRDQRSFEWFVNLLSQLEIEQAEQGGVLERFLDMHMYITSALQKTDMKAVGLQLALELLHEKEKRDLITGLKTRTNAGRPNWDKVFKQLLHQRKGKITVFYCGPPALGRTLRYKCDEYGFDFRKEIF